MLQECVSVPLQHPEWFQTASLCGQPQRGVLLYGPPGTGKTMVARALAKQCGAHFVHLSPSALLSSTLGKTEKLAKSIFTMGQKLAPCVIFFDEIDSLTGARSEGGSESSSRMKAELLAAWDGVTTDVTKRVTVIGATNLPWVVDDAFLRRLPQRIGVQLPDRAGREAILKAMLAQDR